MDHSVAFGIVILAALIHASFQLSVSMVTLLSAHSIGSKASNKKMMRLVSGFLLGVLTMTLLFVSFIGFVASRLLVNTATPFVWSVVSGLMIGVGVAVWSVYYRHKSGTSLWLPRYLARFLLERTKQTKLVAESFSLGLASVVAESMFVIAPTLGAALAILTLPANLQLFGIALYTIIANLGMFIVVVLIGGGHKISSIQKWRESNKRFLQFAAGSALLILGLYIYVNEVLTVTVVAPGAL